MLKQQAQESLLVNTHRQSQPEFTKTLCSTANKTEFSSYRKTRISDIYF